MPEPTQEELLGRIAELEKQVGGRGSRRSLTSREAEVERRVGGLIRDFSRYVQVFDNAPAFTKAGQREKHVATIRLRRELGSAAAAAGDDRFLRSLYATLEVWGIGQRGSRLLPLDAFCCGVRACLPRLNELEAEKLELATDDFDRVIAALWQLIDSLRIVNNEAKLVPCTKALHHLLPDLVVPMDRMFTRVFFAWHVPEFQYQQEKVFRHACRHFSRIARAVIPSRLVGDGWRTSGTKVLDNALVGFCQAESLPVPS